MFPGSSCAGQTTPVYRALAPDGLTGAYMLPPISKQVISPRDFARDFATYMTRALDVGIIREMPVSPAEMEAARRGVEDTNRQARGTMHATVDYFRYLVGYSVGNQPMEEDLEVNVLCMDSMVIAVGHQYSCSATVTRFFAPAKKLEAMGPVFRSLKLTLDQQWWSKWQWAMIDRIHRLSQVQTQRMLYQGQLAGDARMREHQAFMTSFQQGADARNQAFREGQYRKRQMTENVIDHVVDCQRAYSDRARASSANCPDRQTW